MLTLLIGDSNLRKVERRRLDRSGGTHVRTFPGATVNNVTASLSKRFPRNDVKTVIIHVGGNDMKTDVDPPPPLAEEPVQRVHNTAETCIPSSTCAVYWHSSTKEDPQRSSTWVQ